MEWSWGMSEYTECSNFQSSHRFNKIQQKNPWKIVQICGWKKHPKKSQQVNESTGQRAYEAISRKFEDSKTRYFEDAIGAILHF